MAGEISDGRCLQVQIRSGIRYQWALTDFTKFYAGQFLESCPLFFQNAEQQKSFKLKIIKAKPNASTTDYGDETYFLHFNFGNTSFEESYYHIHYCICNRSGDQLTKLESIQLQIVWGKVSPFYLNFITESDLKEMIDQHETLIIDVFMLDVTIPSIICSQAQSVDFTSESDVITNGKSPCNSITKNCHKLFQHDSTNDVMLLVKGHKFLVHKIVLMAKSPTFSVILLPKVLQKNQMLCMTIDDFDPSVVAKMLGYMYLNSVDNIDEIVFDLYRIAQRYHLDELSKICVNRIMMETNAENAMSVFFFAVKNNIRTLIVNTKTFIAMNIDKVLDSSRFTKMIVCYDFEEHGL